VLLLWHVGQVKTRRLFCPTSPAPSAKISLFLKIGIYALNRAVPPREEGRYGQSSRNVRRDAMDAKMIADERYRRVRSSRVVLSPRRWGQVC